MRNTVIVSGERAAASREDVEFQFADLSDLRTEIFHPAEWGMHPVSVRITSARCRK